MPEPDTTTQPDDEILTPENVLALYSECLASEGYSGGVTVEGVVATASFDPDITAAFRPHIKAMLAELPGQFRKSGGGGWSFLNACMDRKGRQWTGEHRVMEQLFMLGMAAGLVTLLTPRDLWDVLPGGMPYYMVDVDDE